MTGEVRGKTKIEAYLKYLDLLEGAGDVFESYSPNPHNKKGCKEAMVRDPETREWVLHFHLHT